MNELKFLLSFTNSFSLLICNITKLKKEIPFLIFTYNSISLFVQYSNELLPNIKVYIYITSECWFCAPWLWKNDYRICSRRLLLSVALQVKVRKKCNIRLTFQSLLNFFLKHWFKLFRIVGIAHIYGSYIFTTKVIG